MLGFGKPAVYDRRRTLDAAEQARSKGRRRRAIAEYRKVLAREPKDPMVHGKIAPLLAQTKQPSEALKSFTLAAQGYLDQGHEEKAIGVFAQAVTFYPKDATLRWKMAEIYSKLGRKPDAVSTLVHGARAQLGKAGRALRIQMLRKALEHDALHVDATILLAKALAQDRQKQDASALLAKLAATARGRSLRRVRAAQFWLAPTPAALFRWVAAIF